VVAVVATLCPWPWCIRVGLLVEQLQRQTRVENGCDHIAERMDALVSHRVPEDRWVRIRRGVRKVS
jgi:hypothetical protein